MDCKDSEMTERRDEYEFHMEEAKFLMPSPAIARSQRQKCANGHLHPPPLLAGEEELKLGKPTKC